MNEGSTRFGLRAVLSRARAGSRTLRLRGRILRTHARAGARELRSGASSASHPLTEAPDAAPGPSSDAGPASAAELAALRTELAHELERLAAEPPRRGQPDEVPPAPRARNRAPRRTDFGNVHISATPDHADVEPDPPSS